MKTALEGIAQDGLFKGLSQRQHGPAAKVLDVYADLIVKLYWEEKDLAAVVAAGVTAMQYGLFQARKTQVAEQKAALLRKVKAITYNLASFTWPGWDEAGIEIGKTDARLGLEAARIHLALAQELQLDDLRLARAHWMLGAQQLAANDGAGARENFDLSATFAEKAGNEAEHLLGQGFSLLAQLLEQPSAELQNQLEASNRQLAEVEHGADFVQQIESAQKSV